MLEDAAGLGALGLLLLFPGLAAARAPWTAVPFLSLAFWIVSWGWLPEGGPGRGRFVIGMLMISAATASLRLFQPERRRWPGRSTVFVLAAASVRLWPFFRWPVAPGTEMSLHSLEALLFVWRDGVPRTYEPVYPVHAFGAHAPGLASLAADVSLISGLSAPRAVLLVAVAAHALLGLALFALLSAALDTRAAAVVSVLSLALSPVPQSLFASGGNAPILAAALATASAALLARYRGGASAVSAGLMIAAALLCDPMTVAVIGIALAIAIWLPTPRPSAHRLGIAAVFGLVAAAPLARRLDLGPIHFDGVKVAAILPLALAGAFAHARGPLRRAGTIALGLTAAASFHHFYRPGPSAILPDADDLAAMAWIAAHTRPADTICHDSGAAALWIPAVAGRGIRDPVLPPAYADRFPQRACAYRYTRRSAGGTHVFQSGPVRVVKNDP